MSPGIIALLVIGLPILFIGVYWIGTYNRFVNLRQLIENSWSNIDTELKRRYDLIPNLVETVKGYAAHEKDVLERVTQARQKAVGSHGSPNSQAGDENSFVSALRQVFAVAEDYPDLKASRNFLALQDELVITENRIQRSRRFYNGNVKDFNTLLGQFPSNMIGKMSSLTPAEFFEIESAFEREPVRVNI